MTHNLSRRNLFKSAAATSFLPAMGGIAAFSPLAMAAEAPKTARTLKEVVAMTPVEMAKHSEVVQTAYRMITTAAEKLRNPTLRKTVLDILDNPVPTLDMSAEATTLAELKSLGLIDKDRTNVYPPLANATQAPQPFWSAPGSGYSSHHAYPGGLCTHVALNVAVAEAFYALYESVDGLKIDFDDAVGGEILHDLHKPWVFQWEADGSCRKELPLAGTGEHHVLSVAESIRRGIAPSFCVAQACAHEHPGSPAGEKQVVGWLRAAAVIAGVDPVKHGLLAADGKTLPLPRRIEGWVVHLADHDWVISVPACQWVVKALRRLAETTYGVKDEKTFNAMRNYVLCELTAMRLYGILSEKGEEAFAREVARVLKA